MGRRENWQAPRNLTEPHGTLKGGNYTPNPPLRALFFPISPPLVSTFPPPSSLNSVSAVSKRLVLVGERNIRERGKAIGCNGLLRNPAEPGGTPRNPTEHHGLPTGGEVCRRIRLFVAVFELSPASSSHPAHSPIPAVSAASKRLVLVGVWSIGARRKASGRNGPPRNLSTPRGTMGNGKTGKMGRHGTPRSLTEPRGALKGGRYPAKSAFLNFDPLVFSSPLPQFTTSRWSRNARY